MAASCSCPEQWWRAPVYTSVSILLAFIAISSAIQATNRSSTAPSLLAQQRSLNASKAVRSSGFTAIAALLPIFPGHFLPSPNFTVFALRDPAFSDSSGRSPRLMKDFLRYHVSPLALSMDDLLKLPEGSCLPTSLPGKNIVVTRVNPSRRLIEINNVAVSNPDLFLSGKVAIHGIRKPLASLGSPPPSCNSERERSSKINHGPINWGRVVDFLNSGGFDSFSAALRSALEGILEDGKDLRSVTVFAPWRFGIGSSGRILRELDRTVRFHILPRRYNLSELAALPDETSLMTLAPGRFLKVTGNGSGGVRINGVMIEVPDVLSSETVVVHGIARAFDTAQLSTA